MKRRILYLLNSFNRGGAEMGLCTLLKGGLFSGHDLRVFSVVRGSGELIADLERLGSRPVVLVDRERMRGIDLLIAALRLARILRAEKFDALVLSLPQANIMGRFLGRLFQVPRVISFEHNTHLAKGAYERLFRWTSPWVGAMFADCEETARVATRRLYRRAPPTAWIVPLRHFPPAPLLPMRQPAGNHSLVSVGRLTATKNHAAIIRAVGLLKARGLHVTLDVIGEGPLLDELRNLRDACGLESQVGFPGFVDSWWTRKSYDAFVLASRNEGLCLVALEAMWAGIPVIAHPVGGLCDYGTPANMTILPSASPEDIAAGVESLCRDPELASSRRLTAYDSVMRSYSESAVRDAYTLARQSFEAAAPAPGR